MTLMKSAAQVASLFIAMAVFLAPHCGFGQSNPAPASDLPEQMTPIGQGFGGVIPPEAPPSLSDPNFISSLHAIAPLTPEQIHETKRQLNAVQQAEAEPPNGNPSSVVRSISLTLQPGEIPPLIHLFQGNVTTLVFSDATGQPWPVTSVTVGNKNDLAANIVGNALAKASSGSSGNVDGSNIVTLSPLTPNAMGENVTITLEGLDMPFQGQIVTGGNQVDYRIDTTIEHRGPNASDDYTVNSTPEVGSPTLQDFVDGIPPKEATTLTASDPSVQAWYMDGQLYLRTDSVDLISPAYTTKAANISGVEIFQLPAVSIVLVDRNGQPTQVSLSGFPNDANMNAQD